jgi:hypothetical protein
MNLGIIFTRILTVFPSSRYDVCEYCNISLVHCRVVINVQYISTLVLCHLISWLILCSLHESLTRLY